MNCAECGSEVASYCLEERSSHLYLYLCKRCRSALLAHHFDLDLEGYRLGDLEARRSGGLYFVGGMEPDPRVFDFEVKLKGKVVLVLDEDRALGELSPGSPRLFAPCSERAKRRLQRRLGCDGECAGRCEPGCMAEKVEGLWRKAGGG